MNRRRRLTSLCGFRVFTVGFKGCETDYLSHFICSNKDWNKEKLEDEIFYEEQAEVKLFACVCVRIGL